MYLLEWLGAGTAMAGAILMARGVAVPAYALWLLSSLVLTLYGYMTEQYGLLLMQAFFVGVNVMGLRHWRKPATEDNIAAGYTLKESSIK